MYFFIAFIKISICNNGHYKAYLLKNNTRTLNQEVQQWLDQFDSSETSSYYAC